MRTKRITQVAVPLAVVALVAGIAGGVAGALIVGRDDATPAAAPTPALVPVANRSARGLTPEEIYRRDAPGVVVITDTQTQQLPATFFGGPQEQRVQVLGSGFVIDAKGDIVTNDHVVQGATAARVGFSEGSTYPAKVIGTDPTTDLAVVRVDAPASALRPLALKAGSVEVGDSVYAIGNPFGLDRTLTAGIISATGRTIQAPNGLSIDHAIQTDAAINHGNSGGPLLDRYGRVIGVNAQIDTGGTSQGNVGVGFAIPADTARSVVRELLATGHATHAWLGVQVANLDSTIASAVKGLPGRGALIEAVAPAGPAVKAGLRGGRRQVTVGGETVVVGGDAIVSLDGVPVTSAAGLSSAVSSHRPGETVRLGVVRNGEQRTVNVVLGNAPAHA